jgi:hypothetical protein
MAACSASSSADLMAVLLGWRRAATTVVLLDSTRVALLEMWKVALSVAEKETRKAVWTVG